MRGSSIESRGARRHPRGRFVSGETCSALPEALTLRSEQRLVNSEAPAPAADDVFAWSEAAASSREGFVANAEDLAARLTPASRPERHSHR